MNNTFLLSFTLIITFFLGSCQTVILQTYPYQTKQKNRKKIEKPILSENNVIINNLIADYNPKTQSLHTTLINYTDRTIVSLILSEASTKDIFVLDGKISDFNKLNIINMTIKIPVNEISKLKLSLTKSNFINFDYSGIIDNYPDNSKILDFNRNIKVDSINIKSILPINFQDFNENVRPDNIVKIYSGSFIDSNGKNIEFYSTTDPLPLLFVAASVAVAGVTSAYKTYQQAVSYCDLKSPCNPKKPYLLKWTFTFLPSKAIYECGCKTG